MTFLIFLRDFLGGAPYPDSALYQVLGAMNLVNVDIKLFFSRDHVIDASRDFVG